MMLWQNCLKCSTAKCPANKGDEHHHPDDQAIAHDSIASELSSSPGTVFANEKDEASKPGHCCDKNARPGGMLHAFAGPWCRNAPISRHTTGCWFVDQSNSSMKREHGMKSVCSRSGRRDGRRTGHKYKMAEELRTLI